jgi:hypothetical protein
MLFADVKTGHLHAYTSATKLGFLTALKIVIEWYANKGMRVKTLRTDSEKILELGEVGEYLARSGIEHEKSAPYAHYQNFVERYVQTVNKGTSTLLHAQRFLKADHWDRALIHFVDCRNHQPNSKCGYRTPHEIVTGHTTNVAKTFQFSFGDLVAVHVPDSSREWKFDLREEIGIYVGQPDLTVDSAWVYFPYTGQQLVRSGLRRIDISDEAYRQYFSRRFDIRDSSRSSMSDLQDVAGNLSVDFSEARLEDPTAPIRLVASLTQEEEVVPALNPDARAKAVLQATDRRLRSMAKSAADAALKVFKAAVHEPASSGSVIDGDDAFYNMLAIQAMAATTNKLVVRKAIQSEDKDHWIQAIRAEIFALIYETLTLEKQNIDKSKPFLLINATMQLKKKMKDANTLDKFKARCCGCGNELKGFISETFSPTVSAMAHSALHQIAVMDNMVTSTSDTVAAYLNQDYPQDTTPLYIKLPKLVAIICGFNPEQTYRVKKYIYGLPDAGRAYYLAYRHHLLENGYLPTASDPCLFVRFEDGETTYVWFHVDDSFVASTTRAGIDRFNDVLRKRFKITVNDDADIHLGVNMTKMSNGCVKLGQSKLLHQIFTEFPPDSIRSFRVTPVPLRPYDENETDKDRELEDLEARINEYLHLLGMLNYLTRSRPDICTALSFGATHSRNPTEEHFLQLLDVVKYLWETKDKSLIVRNGIPNQPLQLTCYVDASYLTHSDSRSHSGYCMSFGSIGTFYVKSAKQQLIATSSTHAEVRALYHLVLDIVYIVNLCDELRRPIQLPAVVFEDNQPAIDLSASLTGRVKRCKHFLMLVNYIREQVAAGLIALQKIPTEDNIADILTKCITGKSFVQKADHLLGILNDEYDR